MDNLHNQNILVDDLVTFCYNATNPTRVDKAVYDPNKDDKPYIPNCYLKVDVSAIKKSDGDETYQFDLWQSDDGFASETSLTFTIARTFLDNTRLGNTYFLPLDFTYRGYGLELTTGGTAPSITFSASIVKEISKM